MSKEYCIGIKKNENENDLYFLDYPLKLPIIKLYPA